MLGDSVDAIDDAGDTASRPFEGVDSATVGGLPAAFGTGAEAATSALTFDADVLRGLLDPDADVAPRTGARAAVAVVFRQGSVGTELLFIQRATNERDPWSGHMAFPGGRIDPGDVDSHAAAERETLEEIGLDLTGAPRLGSLSALDGGRARSNLIAVHAHAYWLDGPAPEFTMNYEIADVLWVPLEVLADTRRYIDYFYPVTQSAWPGIQLDNPRQVVWGLTLRFLGDLFGRLGVPFITLAP